VNAPASYVSLNQLKGWLIAVSLLGAVLSVSTEKIYFIGLGPLLLIFLAGLRNIHFIFFLLIGSIPFSAEVQVTEILGTDFPDEPLMWFLSLLLIFHFILYRNRIGKKIMNQWIFSLILLHLGWILVSCLFSQHPLLSAKYLAAKSWYILALCMGAWYCLESRRDILNIALVLILGMLPVVTVIVFQHFQTGFSFESVNVSVQPFFRNHVNYGAFLVCLFPLAVGGFILSQRFRWLFTLLIFTWLAAIFFSYSRGAWLALLTGMITVLAIRYRFLQWLAGAIVLLLAAAILYLSSGNRYLNYRPDFDRTIYHQQFRDHLSATYRLTDLSTAERFHRWIGGFRMAEGHYLHGYGPNSFYYEYKPYTVTAFKTYVSVNEERSTVHNYFLLLLIEQGIPGLIIFCLMLGGLFYYVYRWYHNANDQTERVIAAVVAALLGMIVSLNMLSDLVETDKIGGLFFICMGLLLMRQTSLNSAEKPVG
jgi:O-antigen ligase